MTQTSSSTTALHVCAFAYKFTGKERDAESGLDYFGARYYASSMGRWMSPDWSAKEDPVPYARLDDPQTLNLYVYVGNDPLGKADPDGHDPFCWCQLAEHLQVAISHYTDTHRLVTKAEVRADLKKFADRVFSGAGPGTAGPYIGPLHNQGAKPEIVIDGSKHPESAQHAADAQAAGHPADVTIDRGGAAGRRADALGGTPAVPGAHRDEYPPATTTQGGTGASVRPISLSDNTGAGASMGNQMRPHPDGTTVTIKPINVPKPPQ